MVRIRLRRVGRKNQASFRLVAADKESPRDGRFIEILGFYNPRTEPATITLKEDRIYDWLSKGAQLSDSAERVCRSAGLLERYERFKGGEAVETLLAEATEAEETRNANPKTRRDDLTPKKKAKPAEEPVAEEPQAVEAEAEPVAEEPAAEAEAEPVAEEEPAVEAEAEVEEAAAEEAEPEAEE
ncbi:MAG: 30S ribosomal protein S16 [Anaerolineales bacterium]|nr:30S ribosomal protein S16 [Anaerolineales bacterium]